MIYTQFYQKSAISDDFIEALGDRSVIILDGRNTRFTHRSISAGECRKRGYLAWRLYSGESFSRSAPISEIQYI
jgi:hypothetical protein